MTGPKRSTTNADGSRLYDWKGEKFWSVTTMLNAYPKPALPPWAAREAARFAAENYETVGRILHPKGAQTTEKTKKAAIDLIKGAPWRDRDEAADIGTIVHQWVSDLILDKKIEASAYDAEVQPFLDAFLSFASDYNVTFEASEFTVYNRKEKYAGSSDGIAVIPKLAELYAGPRCLFDVKTGKGVYAEVAMQLAAYGHGEFIGLPNGTEVPMPAVDVGATLHLRPGLYPKGYALIPARIDESVFQAFLFVREVWRYQNETGKEVLGVPLTAEDVA